MMAALFKPFALMLIVSLGGAAEPAEDFAEPYRILQRAHSSLDPALAASAYASDASLIFEYPGQPREEFRGTEAIRASYVRSFGQVDPGVPMTVNFRFDGSGPGADPHSGAFRLHATVKGRPITVYGRFAVKLVKQDGHWRFAEDQGFPATAADFDRLPE